MNHRNIIQSAFGAAPDARSGPPEGPALVPAQVDRSRIKPADTWGVVAAIEGEKNARQFAVPAMRAYGSETWKKMEIEIEWSLEPSKAAQDLDRRGSGHGRRQDTKCQSTQQMSQRHGRVSLHKGVVHA